jgi:hypothetical protein
MDQLLNSSTLRTSETVAIQGPQQEVLSCSGREDKGR